MDHKEILDKIELIEIFFGSIGLKKVKDIGTTWDLDSYIKYHPIEDNYIVTYKGEDRVLINIEVGIMGGILFVLSGKMGVSVYESIKTDYNFVSKYEDGHFFQNEYRDWILENVLK